MKNRIFGIETEYGLLIKADNPDVSPSWVARRIIQHLFGQKKHGVIDWHYRGHDEPPGNGGFLLNAGRMYVDMGHLEYASRNVTLCGILSLSIVPEIYCCKTV
jgi:proteasome accessory factor A